MQFTATVISGTGKGKTIGFPTLNLNLEEVPALPEGVYACFVRLGLHGNRVPAAMHYGKRPTLHAEPSCEVHVLDQIVAIPPHSLLVEPCEMIRTIQDFGSKEHLSAQLQADCEQIRDMLCAPC